MVCATCGSSLSDGAKFCSGCGRAVDVPVAAATGERKLVRPREGRKIAGVCAGIALYTGWDLTMVRLVAVLAILLGVGMPLLAYLIGWIVMPDAPYAVQTPANQGPGATIS